MPLAHSLVSLVLAASPALTACLPYANTCDAEVTYDYHTGWSARCVGTCNPGEGTCGSFQSGNPVGPAVPLSCKCSSASYTIPCVMQWWIHSETGAWLGAGCRFPGEECGPVADPQTVCTDIQAPVIPPSGPVPLWDSCNCQ